MQESVGLAFAEARGFSVSPEHIFREIFSGAAWFGRPALTRLRSTVRRGEVDIVLVYSVDRLTRAPSHLELFMQELRASSVSLELVGRQAVDGEASPMPTERAARIAALEHARIRERVERGRLARLHLRGLPLGSHYPPFGYAFAAGGDSLLINETHAATVRSIFGAYATGESLHGIARRLTAAGVPTPRGGRAWSLTTVRNVLSNPVYVGRAVALRRRLRVIYDAGQPKSVLRERGVDEWVHLPNVASALVPDEHFEAAARRLAQNRAEQSRPSVRRDEWLLRGGFLRCGYCDYAMDGFAITYGPNNKNRKQGRLPAYRCGRAQTYHDCERHCVTARKTDEAVWEYASSLLDKPGLRERVLERLESGATPERDLATIDDALADVQRRADEIERSARSVRGEHVKAVLVEELEMLRATCASLKREQLSARERLSGERAAYERVARLLELCLRDRQQRRQLSNDEKRTLLAALGVTARVYRSDHDPRLLVASLLG